MTGKEPDLSKGFIEITETDLGYFADAYFTYLLMRIAESRLFHLESVLYRSQIFRKIRSKLKNEEFQNIINNMVTIQLRCLDQVRSRVKYYDYYGAVQIVCTEGKEFQQLIIDKCNSELSNLDEIDPKEIEKCVEKLTDHISSEFSTVEGSELRFAVKYLVPFYRNKAVVGQYKYSFGTGRSRKDAFHKKYIDPVLNQSEHHKENSFLCRHCKRNYVHPERFSDDDSFFTEGMFSIIALTKEFTNFYYNSQPDLFICDICELIILCAWAGFTKIPWQFQDKITNTDHIFVNIYSLELLWEQNNKIYNEYQASTENIREMIYPEIIQDLFQRPFKTKGHWVIQNILFIEIKSSYKRGNDRPNLRYYHIGHDIADLFLGNSDGGYAMNALSKLTGKVVIHNNISPLPLRRVVVQKILNHETLFPLCYALVISHLHHTSEGNNLRNLFNILIISSIRSYIGFSMVGKKHLLSSADIFGILKGTKEYGDKFAEDIDYDTRIRKSYVLLSMIRNDKIEDFYDVLLKMYMSVNKPVPARLIAMLNEKDEIGFRARAYAFMSGFLSANTK